MNERALLLLPAVGYLKNHHPEQNVLLDWSTLERDSLFLLCWPKGFMSYFMPNRDYSQHSFVDWDLVDALSLAGRSLQSSTTDNDQSQFQNLSPWVVILFTRFMDQVGSSSHVLVNTGDSNGRSRCKRIAWRCMRFPLLVVKGVLLLTCCSIMLTVESIIDCKCKTLTWSVVKVCCLVSFGCG